MTKRLATEFKQALSQPVLTFCWCWLITRRDGLMIGFTSVDQELKIGDVYYRPFTGFDAGAAQVSQGLDKLDSQALAGILDQSGIDKQELFSGVYQGAEVRRFLVNYLDLPTSFNTLGAVKFIELPRGYIGEIKSNNLGFEVNVKDSLSLLDRSIGSATSMTCRCNLGDKLCRVNLTTFTHQVTVSEVLSRRAFKISAQFTKGYLDRGRLKFDLGNNANIHRDIGFHVTENLLILYEPLPFDITIGDELTVVAGCLKTEFACVVKFRNFANFQGEPDVPTTDLALNTPSR